MPQPNWTPAEQHLPHRLLVELMHMGAVTVAGRQIEQYKHDMTRRYLNLDQQGRAWDIAVHPITGEVSARRTDLAAGIAHLEGEVGQ